MSDEAATGVSAPSAVSSAGDGFLRDLWYFGCHSADLGAAGVVRRLLLGEPVVLARLASGRVAAMRDICPHRAAPLSAGRVVGETVECPYHGWRFGADGRCAAIPALLEDDGRDVSTFRVRRYPTREVNGIVWVYVGTDRWGEGEPASAPPALPLPAEARPGLTESLVMPCGIDDAVVGLMDPAHGPFVHESWWWRRGRSIHAKAKKFAPSELGFTMVRHAPSRNSLAYRLLGRDLETEIAFRLPGVRIETIAAGDHKVVGVTTVTPRTATETDVTQTFFWTVPWLGALTPVVRPFVRRFLRQDGDMMALQAGNLVFAPRMTLMDDADTQAKWYYKLKKEWQASRMEDRAFANPVPEATLRWRS